MYAIKETWELKPWSKESSQAASLCQDTTGSHLIRIHRHNQIIIMVMIILDIKTIIITIVFSSVKISVIIVFMIITNCHLYIKFVITIKIVIIIIMVISRTALFSWLPSLPSITTYHHDIIWRCVENSNLEAIGQTQACAQHRGGEGDIEQIEIPMTTSIVVWVWPRTIQRNVNMKTVGTASV